jgi:hypothetical protein
MAGIVEDLRTWMVADGGQKAFEREAIEQILAGM